jgi:hypothetical protein
MEFPSFPQLTTMSIRFLIESVGLSAEELRRYLLSEIDEFLAAADPAAMEEEFGDALFALACMAWAHSGRHFGLGLDATEAKLRRRLRDYGTITRRPRKYADGRIAEMEIGVLHFAFGQFGGHWHQFDPIGNGTAAEVTLLTDAPFGPPDNLTNHCIVTFADTDELIYDVLYSAATTARGNTIRCEIPNFMYDRAKKQLKFAQFGELLALQILGAIDGVRLAPGAVAHFHSWEAGFLAESPEFWRRISSLKTIFSPYLTTGRLAAFVEARGGAGWTMTQEELSVAARFERLLSEACMRVVLESSQDRDFFVRWIHYERIVLRSFARQRSASIPRDTIRDGRLAFVAGGRPVREKGFVELCRQFGGVRDWAVAKGLEATLSILCQERNLAKGAEYIAEMERAIAERGLGNAVAIEPKVSLDELRRRIGEAAALVVPSLYDSYNLMPTYAIEAKRPAFVSCHAGISENLRSRDFVFDPEVDGDLVRAIRAWYENDLAFDFESRFPSYLDLYFSKGMQPAWG